MRLVHPQTDISAGEDGIVNDRQAMQGCHGECKQQLTIFTQHRVVDTCITRARAYHTTKFEARVQEVGKDADMIFHMKESRHTSNTNLRKRVKF